ncbi:MAG: sulfurtransferase TusA family protein [Actinobacteria bacterium]|nr:sulfurtransferase TusA family protein [Actinomycetota bacterium]
MTEHTLDAGTLGCGDGLAAWFRQQLRGASPGDTLRCIVRDPSAREELPALARLMGHTCTSIEAIDDHFLITVEIAK